jgi:quercetin dioxygenase-like cupin family protein
VSVQRYEMGGQRTLRVELVVIAPRGRTAAGSPLVEENVVVLSGEGHTVLTGSSGAVHEVPWTAGDLVCSPLGVRREHVAGPSEVRLLRVSNVAMELALGIDADADAYAGPYAGIPDRLAALRARR